MQIVLNEREWVENAISARELGKFPSETLSRVARYYYHIYGYTKRAQLREKVEAFLLKCDPDAQLARWDAVLDRVTGNAAQAPLIELRGIDITEDEMRVIQSLNGSQLQRLAVTLLCVAKYWNACRETNNGWVNLQDEEIASMANLNCGSVKRSELLRRLRDLGLVKFSKRVDNLNVQVLFIMNSGPVAMHISDVRNIGYQYSAYCGEPYIQCAQCGLTIRKKNNAHKYCNECAADLYVRQCLEKGMHVKKLL